MKTLKTLLLSLLSSSLLFATDYDIYPDNSGQSPSFTSFFVDAPVTLVSGDVVIFHQGSYRNTLELSGIRGTLGNEITFKAATGEKVSFDGTIPITNSWQSLENGIYRTTVDDSIFSTIRGRSYANDRTMAKPFFTPCRSYRI